MINQLYWLTVYIPAMANWFPAKVPGKRRSPIRWRVAWCTSIVFTWETKRSPGEANIAMENGHRNSGFTHWKWCFSIAMLLYQRVCFFFFGGGQYSISYIFFKIEPCYMFWMMFLSIGWVQLLFAHRKHPENVCFFTLNQFQAKLWVWGRTWGNFTCSYDKILQLMVWNIVFQVDKNDVVGSIQVPCEVFGYMGTHEVSSY